jgi:hypothetical protein
MKKGRKIWCITGYLEDPVKDSSTSSIEENLSIVRNTHCGLLNED